MNSQGCGPLTEVEIVNGIAAAEHYVHQLQGYGLHATMEREE